MRVANKLPYLRIYKCLYICESFDVFTFCTTIQDEEEIAGSRRYYNGVVNKYNTKAEMFPGNIVAGIFKFTRKPLYEISDEAERENVKVSF